MKFKKKSGEKGVKESAVYKKDDMQDLQKEYDAASAKEGGD